MIKDWGDGVTGAAEPAKISPSEPVQPVRASGPYGGEMHRTESVGYRRVL